MCDLKKSRHTRFNSFCVWIRLTCWLAPWWVLSCNFYGIYNNASTTAGFLYKTLTCMIIQAGITEHAVMFPVDSIKVCVLIMFLNSSFRPMFCKDANASVRNIPSSSVHWCRECIYSNIIDGRHSHIMAGSVVRDTGSGACTCRTFWNL